MSALDRLDCIVKTLFGKYAYVLKKMNQTGEFYVLKVKVDGVWQEHVLGKTYQDALKEIDELCLTA